MDSTPGPQWQSRALTVGELAKLIEGFVEGDTEARIIGVSSIEDAQMGDVVFAEDARFLTRAAKSRASAIVAFVDAVTPDKPLIRVENPRLAFNKILELFKPSVNIEIGTHETAFIGRGVRQGIDVSIGPNAVIADNVLIGDRSIIMAGCYVGEDAAIGEDCILYPNVTLSAGSVLGNRVLIHSGAVIGADGFGYMRVGDHSVKVPQLGNVELGDDVEIGANTTIDRAKTGSTVIGARTKIDNLVHVAHNVKTGTDCIIVAQVGIAGSATLGRGIIIAGQAGVKDHVTIGDGVVVMGQSAVFGDVEPGIVISGYPARAHMEKMRIEAAVNKLPEYVKRVRALEKSNAELAASNEKLQKMVGLLAEKLGIDADV
jgi:UDP-3-O-[3-hydroxymyristoyl] glucosamine N-acyltransferase